MYLFENTQYYSIIKQIQQQRQQQQIHTQNDIYIYIL